MSKSLKWMVLCLAAVAFGCGYWCIGSVSGEANSAILAARYHTRSRTANFFQRAGTQGHRTGSSSFRAWSN
jgi:hypothetical protein